MNDLQQSPAQDAGVELREQARDRAPGRPLPEAEHRLTKSPRRIGRRLLGAGASLLLCAAVGVGFWRHHNLYAQVTARAEQRRDFIPSVRAAPVCASGDAFSVSCGVSLTLLK
jgi:ferric-dicitrate binding protein FerR (iron transport regulator)